MYLARLEIQNFRKIAQLDIRFKTGLNILLGENNIGKTTIIDALRSLLGTVEDAPVRLGLEDTNSVTTPAITFKYTFKSLSIDQASEFMGAVMQDPDGSFTAIFSAKYESPDTFGRFKLRRFCGEHATTQMTSEMVDQLRGVYLPPLRDASRGLKPGVRSQLARLLQLLATEAGMNECQNLLTQVDTALDATQPISATKAAITDQYNGMLGAYLTQELQLNLSPLDMNKVAARLAILADGFEVERNGLGYNNLIFMAAILGELSLTNDAVYRCLMIEEPEAHLHPQLQSVLLKYFQQQSERNDQVIQLFVTTHSPHFAAFSELDNLISIRQRNAVLVAFPIKSAPLHPIKKRKLQRYLDVSRSDLFFARAIIMVEGAAEKFLIPALAAYLNIDLRQFCVSLVSTDGLNFDCFLPLFGANAIPMKVSVVTDRDPTNIPFPRLNENADISSNTQLIVSTDDSYRSTFYGAKTLEYDLALQGPINRHIMLQALHEIHPDIAAALSSNVATFSDNTQAAICLFNGMFARGAGLKNVSKGRFAQELADKIRERPMGLVVPSYIVRALNFITVPTPPIPAVPPPPAT